MLTINEAQLVIHWSGRRVYKEVVNKNIPSIVRKLLRKMFNMTLRPDNDFGVSEKGTFS